MGNVDINSQSFLQVFACFFKLIINLNKKYGIKAVLISSESFILLEMQRHGTTRILLSFCD